MISLSGCNSKKKNSSDKLQPQTDYYSCNIINKYTDITPASIYPVINDENIVMNGYQNLPVSEICIKSSDENSVSILDETFNKHVIDIFYSDKYKDDLFIIFTDENQTLSVVDYNCTDKTEKNIISFKSASRINIDTDSEGNIIIPEYSDNNLNNKLVNIHKYSPITEKTDTIHFSDSDFPETSDLCTLSFKHLDSEGYMILYYNTEKELYEFGKYNDNFVFEYLIESKDDRIYSDEYFFDYCFSNNGELQIICCSDDINTVVDCYDIKSGNFLRSYQVMPSDFYGIINGSDAYSYYCYNEHSLNGVKDNGEIEELVITDDSQVMNFYQSDGKWFYICSDYCSQRKITYIFDKEFEIIKEPEDPVIEDYDIYYSYYDNNDNEIHLINDENNLLYIIKSTDLQSDTISPAINEYDTFPAYISIENDVLTSVFYDYDFNFSIISVDLKNYSKTDHVIGKLPEGTEFLYTNNCLYYLYYNDEADSTDIYKYNNNSNEKICSFDDNNVHFTQTCSEYDFCCFTSKEIYAYYNNQNHRLLVWKEIQYIPQVLEVFVNKDHSINIFGVNNEQKLNIYQFTKTNTPNKAKKTVTVWGNMDFDSTFPDTSAERIKHLIDNINCADYEYIIETQYFSFEDLRKKILTDDAPDIILCQGHLEKSFSGYMENLSDIFSDDGIKKQDYYDKIIDLGKKDNNIYEIYPEFLFDSFYTINNDYNTSEYWSIDDLLRTASEKKYQKVFYGDRIYTLDSMFYNCLDNFIDTGNNKISINNSKTIELLELIKNCSEEQGMTGYDTGSTRRNQCLLENTLFSLSVYNNLSDPKTNTYPNIIGIPSSEKKCVSISPEFSASIVASSENKENAKNFIKMLLSDEYQNNTNLIPLKRSSLKLQAENNNINAETLNNFERYLDNNVVLSFSYSSIGESLMNTELEYLNNTISTEELIKFYEDKIGLFLGESN